LVLCRTDTVRFSNGQQNMTLSQRRIGKCIPIIALSVSWTLVSPFVAAQTRASVPADPVYGASPVCSPEKTSPVTPLGHLLRFTDSTFSWKTIVSPALTAGLAQWSGRNDGFPNNLNGYARHYGANILGNVSGKFFGSFVLPTLLQQDEKFERRGSSGRWLDRITHVFFHSVWVGQGLVPMNVSGLGASGVSAILANAYLPQSQRTARASAIRFGLSTATYVAGDAYTEFSPDLERTLKRVGLFVFRRKPSRFLVALPFDYSDLSKSQQQLVPAQQWASWHLDQKLEFAGATQALDNWCRFDLDCSASPKADSEPDLGQLAALGQVYGSIPGSSSESQFNVEVSWKKSADHCFQNAYKWGPHIALLHPNMYGYDQNKDNDGFLGLVVLFDHNDPTKGQFHIGFGDSSHYNAEDNSDITRNYADYCQWYGQLKLYQPCPEARLALLGVPAPPPPPEIQGALPPATPEEQLKLRTSVEAFLNSWYVKRDYEGFARSIATDNIFSFAQSLGGSPWNQSFQGAFRTPNRTEPVRRLTDAIGVSEITLPKGSARLRYLNVNPAGKISDPFAIIDPASTPPGMFLPRPDLPIERQDRSTQFLTHLERNYPGRLYLVLYVTKNPSLIQTGIVMYWILEASDWKLAAIRGSD